MQICQVTAKLAGKSITLVVDTQEVRQTPAYKSFNPTNRLPLLETAEGNLCETQAIAKYIAFGHATLLGSSAIERAHVDQWLNWLQSGVM